MAKLSVSPPRSPRGDGVSPPRSPRGDGRKLKGTFGDARLPVARKYLYPVSRNPLLLAGLVLIVAAAAYVAFDFFVRDAHFLSNGPLSSSHAVLEDDCGACHDGSASLTGETVTSEKCSVCHEKYGDQLGVYTWGAHYVYRSNDFQRVADTEHETTCAACHLEHRGREASITQVSDSRCQRCHEFASFNDGHPQFDFAAEEIPDDMALTFPHIQHVRELRKELGVDEVERTCLYCHNAESDGKGFEPISFDRHCDSCHLTTALRTPPLPVAAEASPGVLTLDDIRARRAPGTHWALFMGPGEFRERGGEVSKSPVYHEDPWILENLRILRRRLFSDPGLADLLQASADTPPEDLPELYEEAIATLEAYALGLRSRGEGEIRQELERIDAVLDDLRRRLRDPLTPLDETRFLLALESRRTDTSEDEVIAVEDLVFDLTAVCQQCHVVEDATVARVRKSQSVLRRAEFDHRAHILQVRCLECHDQIPIEDYPDLSNEPEIDPNVDHAGIQNVPAIETCQQCHTPDLSSNRCLTCHYFHPNKSRRSDLSLYLDEEADAP